MKVLLVGKNSKDIAGLVKNSGFDVVSENPDTVISFGGDGTLLYGEIHYPGIPKLALRDSRFCHKCSDHLDEALLTKLKNHRLRLKEYTKLETKYKGQTLLALNDFVIRNEQAIHAIRFQITSVSSQLFIGDGIVLSTSFGSSGYFKSITQKTFQEGFGLAFNNTTQKIDPIFLNKDGKVEFKLIRGVAILTFDNSSRVYPVEIGKVITFKLSSQTAKIYEADSLRCSKCQVIRG